MGKEESHSLTLIPGYVMPDTHKKRLPEGSLFLFS